MALAGNSGADLAAGATLVVILAFAGVIFFSDRNSRKREISTGINPDATATLHLGAAQADITQRGKLQLPVHLANVEYQKRGLPPIISIQNPLLKPHEQELTSRHTHKIHPEFKMSLNLVNKRCRRESYDPSA